MKAANLLQMAKLNGFGVKGIFFTTTVYVRQVTRELSVVCLMMHRDRVDIFVRNWFFRWRALMW